MMWRLGLLLWFLILSLAGYADPFVRFEEKGKVGLKDEAGNVLIPASFEALGWSDGNFSVIGQITGYKLKDKWGIINLQKQFLTPAGFESLTYSGGDRIIASKKLNPFTSKFGCLDLSGKMVVPFNYDGITISGLRAIVFVKNDADYEYGVIDLSDRGIIPLRYQQIVPLGTLRYAVENKEHKAALFSDDGRQLTPFTIDSISDYHHGFAIVYQHFAQGIIDRDGDIKVPSSYREVAIKEDGSLWVRGYDEWKIVNQKNQEILSIHADELTEAGKGLYRLTLAGKVGLVDKDMKSVVPPDYDFLSQEDHGHWVAAQNGKFGVIRKNNTWLLPDRFDSAFLDQLFVRTVERINNQRTWSVYDTFGIQKTTSPHEWISPYNGKFFTALNHGYYGAINRYGEEFIKCVFDSLLEWKDDQVAVRFKGLFGIISFNENWLLTPQPDTIALAGRECYFQYHDGITFLKDFLGQTIYFTSNKIKVDGDHLKEYLPDGLEKNVSFQGLELTTGEIPEANSPNLVYLGESEGLRLIRKDGKYGFIDSRGRLLIANRYDEAANFHEGLAPIKLIGHWGYVDLNDRIAINPNYDHVGFFDHGLAIVQKEGKTGLIDKQGKVILPLRYSRVTLLTDLTYLLEVSKDSRTYGLADEKGSVLIEPLYDSLTNLENGYVLVGREGKWGVLSRDGLSTIPIIYDHIDFETERNLYRALKKSSWKEFR